MTPSPPTPSILDESPHFDKFYKAAQNDRDRLLAQVAMGMDDIRPPILLLKAECPKLTGKGDCGDEEVRVIEAKGKVWMALSEHWGKITVTIIIAVLSFLAGHFIAPIL